MGCSAGFEPRLGREMDGADESTELLKDDYVHEMCKRLPDNIKHKISHSKPTSVTSKKLPNVYKNCPKMISLEKLKILTPLQKLP